MKRLASAVLALYRREPARANGLIASAVSLLFVRVGLQVDDADVLAAVGVVVPLVAAEVTRRLVTPTVNVGSTGRLQAHGGDWQPVNPDVRRRVLIDDTPHTEAPE